jgi:hypothetical protein
MTLHLFTTDGSLRMFVNTLLSCSYVNVVGVLELRLVLRDESGCT